MGLAWGCADTKNLGLKFFDVGLELDEGFVFSFEDEVEFVDLVLHFLQLSLDLIFIVFLAVGLSFSFGHFFLDVSGLHFQL